MEREYVMLSKVKSIKEYEDQQTCDEHSVTLCSSFKRPLHSNVEKPLLKSNCKSLVQKDPEYWSTMTCSITLLIIGARVIIVRLGRTVALY